MILFLVMTDGREHITDAIRSAEEHLHGPITERVIHDDSGDEAHRLWLNRTFPDYRVIYRTQRQGFSGAYANAWRFLAQQPQRWVFSTEDDFVFRRDVDLNSLMHVMVARPYLAQMALRRQPWSVEEKAAGGIVELDPASFTDRDDDRDPDQVAWCNWLEHRKFFTTNPSLFSRELTELGWPEVAESEGHFTRVLTAEPSTRFGFWGKRDDEPWVTHVGTQRVGHGY